MSLEFLHCVLKVKQLNCDAAGTISTLLRFLGTFGGGVNSGLNGSSGVGMGLDGFGIGIAVGNGVKSGNTFTGAFVGTSAGGFVGCETGTVDGVTIGAGVDGVTTGGAGFVGALITDIVVFAIGELGGVNSGSLGFVVVGDGGVNVDDGGVNVDAGGVNVDDTGNVVVGTTIVLHCWATKLSGIVSQFSHTKHWSWAEAVNEKLI